MFGSQMTLRARLLNLALGSASALAMAAAAGLPAAAQGIEEITVTATKRAESLQDVGFSITAIGAEKLQRTGIGNFFDYATRIPNLGFGSDADGLLEGRRIAIRGIGAGSTFSAQGTTGFYIDEVPVPETVNLRVVDFERVEVLRGPQGTLYGARSMGGTVRNITKAVSLDETTINAHVSGGNVGEGGWNYQIDGSFNTPIVENVLAITALAYAGRNSGFIDQVSFPDATTQFSKEDVDDETYYGANVSLLWQPTDKLSIQPRLIYQKVELDGFPLADVELAPDRTAPLYQDSDDENLTNQRYLDIDEEGEDDLRIASLTTKYEEDYGEFLVALGYVDRRVEEFEDDTRFYIDVGLAGPQGQGAGQGIRQIEDVVYWSGEARFSSNFREKFDFPIELTAGYFFQRSFTDRVYTGNYIIPEEAFGAPFEALGFPPFFRGPDGELLIFTTFQQFDTREQAVFGEATIHVNDRIRLIGGARWSVIKTEQVEVANGLANGDFTMSAGSQRETSVNPKFAVEYDATDEMLLYATFSRGFRVGGVNGPFPITGPIGEPCAVELDGLGLNPEAFQASARDGFTSDFLWNYEGGFKSSWFDNGLVVNAAGFYIEWSDLQQALNLNCGFGATVNAGEARSRGFELEMQANPIGNVAIDLGVGYTDAEISGVPGFLASSFSVGDALANVPKWTVNGGIENTFENVYEEVDLYARIDAQYVGEAVNFAGAASPRIRPSYTIVNARAGLYYENYSAVFFISNLTDERANQGTFRALAAEAPSRPRVLLNRPRTFGIELRGRF